MSVQVLVASIRYLKLIIAVSVVLPLARILFSCYCTFVFTVTVTCVGSLGLDLTLLVVELTLLVEPTMVLMC